MLVLLEAQPLGGGHLGGTRRIRLEPRPGRLVGAFTMLMGIFRFGLEFFREPDAGIHGALSLSMGQTLSIPMILVGGYFFFTAKARRQRVESVAGTESVA